MQRMRPWRRRGGGGDDPQDPGHGDGPSGDVPPWASPPAQTPSGTSPKPAPTHPPGSGGLNNPPASRPQQGGAPWDPQSQQDAPWDPQSQQGAPWDPQPQQGAPDPQPQQGAPWDPQPQQGAPDPQPQQPETFPAAPPGGSNPKTGGILGRLRSKLPGDVSAPSPGALPETFAAAETPKTPILERIRQVFAATSAEGPESIRKADVTVLDGRLLVRVSVRRGVVTAVEHTDFGSHQEAVAAAGRRGGDVVWASPGVRGFDLQVHEGSPRARRFLDASAAAKTFAVPARVVRQGKMMFGMSDEALAPLLRKCRLRFSACAVHDRSGYWLRVGQSMTEMSMVQNGEIAQWAMRADHSVSQVAEMISLGRPAVEALNEQTIELAKWVAQQRNQWLLRDSSSGTLLLHGPGEGWAGVDTVLREISSCRVVPARIVDVAPTAAGPQVGHITAAVLGYLSPKAYSTRRALQAEVLRARLKQLLPVIATSVAVLVIALISWQQGQGIQNRTAAAGQRQTQAASIDTPLKLQLQEDRLLAEEALAVRSLGEELTSPEMFAELTEVARDAPENISEVTVPDLFAWRSVVTHKINSQIKEEPDRDTYSAEVARCEELDVEEISPQPGFAGIEQAQETMTSKAVEIFGEGAVATEISSSEAYSFDEEGRSSVRYTLRPPPEVCPNDQ